VSADTPATPFDNANTPSATGRPGVDVQSKYRSFSGSSGTVSMNVNEQLAVRHIPIAAVQPSRSEIEGHRMGRDATADRLLATRDHREWERNLSGD
jgi:hypothetical protein